MMQDSKNNGNGADKDDHDTPHEDNSHSEDNVVRLSEIRRREKERLKAEKSASAHPPMINLPPMTKAIILLNAAVFLGLFFMGIDAQGWAYIHLGFIPARFIGEVPFSGWYEYLSPITHMFLHSGWLHVIMNIAMLGAFGAGVERAYGIQRYVSFYMLCGLMGVIAHMMLDPFSAAPVVGASGAISGLFAPILIILQRAGAMGQGKYGLWPIIIMWCGVSFLFAWAGGAGIGDIAWAAHLGGFLGAFALMRIPYFKI